MSEDKKEETKPDHRLSADHVIKVIMKDKTYTFYLKQMTRLEDMQLRQQFSTLNDITDEAEKSIKNYKINADAIAKNSIYQPDLPDGGKYLGNSCAETVQKFFSGFNAHKDWIAEYVVMKYQTAQIPQVDFL